MDGRTTFSKIERFLKDVKVDEISFQELRKLLFMHIGSDERTLSKCMKIMVELGIIQDMGDCKFKILKNA